MAKDPAFLFYPGDYLRDTQCLSEKSQVAYDRIMCEHMRNICISQEQLNFFTKRLNDEEKQELLMVLSPIKGGFHIPWVTDSITKRREYSESRRKNREGTDKKKVNNISKSYDSHMENENEIEDENINEWIRWGKLIVSGTDQYWEAMKGKRISQSEMDSFLSVATRNKWKINTQHEFRLSLKGFESNKKEFKIQTKVH